MKIFSLAKKYLEGRRIKKLNKVFIEFNKNKFKLEKPELHILSEFYEALNYNRYLKTNLKSILNHERTPEHWGYSFKVAHDLMNRYYWQSNVDNLHLASTSTWPKDLVSALPGYGTSSYKVFNSCITMTQFIFLLNKVDKVFSKKHKAFRIKIMSLIYRHVLDLTHLNSEGVTDHDLKRVVKNILFLSKANLKNTFTLYKDRNIFYSNY